MAGSKVPLFTILLVASFAVAVFCAKSHHLEVGGRPFADHLLAKEHIFKSSKILRVITDTWTYSGGPYTNITFIKALDQKDNGDGAHAAIINGGIGRNTVTLKFKSERNHGIDFMVEIYGITKF